MIEKLNIEKLITHQFDFEKSEDAYKMIMDKKEDYVGILLKYNTNVETNEKKKYHKKTKKFDYVNIGLIGAGSFAQNILLPKLKNNVIWLEFVHQRKCVKICR